jgi:RHS repeat-associated protein
MVYDAADRLIRWPGMHSYTYYGDGSMKDVRNPAGTQVLRSYTYNDDGLLSGATYPGGTASFTWDADKNRVGITMNEGNYSFVYDTTAGIPAVIEEVTPDGFIFYIREPGGELLARVDENQNIRYYHFDELGSTRMLTDGTGNAQSNPNFGKVTDKYVFDAWGNTLSYTGSTDQPYQYVGEQGYYTHTQDSEFGLMQLGVRFYDAEIGRFTQTDPASYGLNLYTYVDSKPCLFVDPKGLWCEHITKTKKHRKKLSATIDGYSIRKIIVEQNYGFIEFPGEMLYCEYTIYGKVTYRQTITTTKEEVCWNFCWPDSIDFTSRLISSSTKTDIVTERRHDHSGVGAGIKISGWDDDEADETCQALFDRDRDFYSRILK